MNPNIRRERKKIQIPVFTYYYVLNLKSTFFIWFFVTWIFDDPIIQVAKEGGEKWKSKIEQKLSALLIYLNLLSINYTKIVYQFQMILIFQMLWLACLDKAVGFKAK